ncbi:MAG TPA: YetF domain-containing protein [Arthrobacter sp.]|nr:YetF domain-containing protein [Arthrobacter sp.]
MWFDSWAEILRVLIIGSVSYVALVVVLRVSGKRTLGQLNAFDFIVTVAIGSTLATILLSSDVASFEGLTALALLAGLQFVVAWASAHVPGARDAVTARPVALVISGELQHDQLRSNRLSESEVLQAVCSTGSGDLSDVEAVVLENQGKYQRHPPEQTRQRLNHQRYPGRPRVRGPMTELGPGYLSGRRPASRNGSVGALFGPAHSKRADCGGRPRRRGVGCC